MHLNLPDGNTMLGSDGCYRRINAMDEHVMAIGDLPGACIAQHKDSQRERHGESQMHLNLPDGNTMLGFNRFEAINEHMMAIGELPGACVARKQDSQRERKGETQMHLHLPDGDTMLGNDGYNRFNAIDATIMSMSQLPGACVA